MRGRKLSHQGAILESPICTTGQARWRTLTEAWVTYVWLSLSAWKDSRVESGGYLLLFFPSLSLSPPPNLGHTATSEGCLCLMTGVRLQALGTGTEHLAGSRNTSA